MHIHPNPSFALWKLQRDTVQISTAIHFFFSSKEEGYKRSGFLFVNCTSMPPTEMCVEFFLSKDDAMGTKLLGKNAPQSFLKPKLLSNFQFNKFGADKA